MWLVLKFMAFKQNYGIIMKVSASLRSSLLLLLRFLPPEMHHGPPRRRHKPLLHRSLPSDSLLSPPLSSSHWPQSDNFHNATWHSQIGMWYGQTFALKKKIYLFTDGCTSTCGILVLWPGIKHTCPALDMQSLNCWTTRAVPYGWTLST